MKNKTLFILFWATTIICFVVGISKPAFVMNITLGSLWIDMIAESLLGGGFGETKLSIIDSVWKLITDKDFGNIFLGFLIMLFSIVFPGFKYTLLIIAFLRSNETDWTKKILKYGYWSMLDVFVVAVLVVSFKGFTGGSRIIPMIGIYFFAASVVLSNFTHKILEKSLKNETHV